MAIALNELAVRLGATVHGNGDVSVTDCASIEHAGPTDVTFLANPKYAQHLRHTKAAGVLIDAKTPCPDHLTRLVCDDPYFAFRNALIVFHGFRTHPEPMDAEPGAGTLVSPRAAVHPEATIGAQTIIHPFAVVERGARVGRGTVLYPGAYVGPGAVVGDECLLYPNVTVYDGCIIGNRVTVHSGTTIGQDGFGYATHDGLHQKIPQTGLVVIEDDVELGAGCAIERTAIGETRIGKGTKFADLISIGHGTKIGSHCLFVSLVGISGSVDVGNYVVLGGQVGVVGHLKIGDRVQAMGKAGIVQDVAPGAKVGGVPAIDGEQAKRNALVATDLHGHIKRLRKLEREVERLRGQLDAERGSDDAPAAG